MTTTAESAARLPWWRRFAYLDVLVAAAVLCAIGDKFPFSPFPMYANPDTSADVMFVTDEKDGIIHTRDAFGLAASGAKKDFEGILYRLARTKEYEDAKPEQVRMAGEQMLEKLYAGRTKKWAEYRDRTTSLRLKMFTVTYKDGRFTEETRVLAERSLPKEP
ncbi:MAG: hypothetical protein KA004_05570 [Verrucomicrobiales bacterium]|nr:hypothetical protein [Verrucomicrobiales bacterium]